MKRHACIAIGINQYQFLQPLSYAQQDAETLNRFLKERAGFVSDLCLLMTDNSSQMWGIPTYPNQENFLNGVEALCREQLKPGDVLWFFFSGYGFSVEGQDYLMPIDGNPNHPNHSAIAITSLFEILKAAPAQTVIVLLDINRSQGARAGQSVGMQTLELARQMEIPTVLSCRPEQLSRETSALRQGFFTTALLEALKSSEAQTIQRLTTFLSRRLPELTDQHLRPKQDPLFAIYPPEQMQSMILPEGVQATPVGVASNGTGLLNSTLSNSYPVNGTLPTLIKPPSPGSGKPGNPSTPPDVNPPQNDPSPVPALAQSPATENPSQTPVNSTEETMSERSFLQQLILWSGTIALVLLLGVFWTNKEIFLSRKSTKTATIPPSPTSTSAVPSKAVTQSGAGKSQPIASAVLLEEAKGSLQNSPASSFSEAIAKARQIPENDPLYDQAQTEIERWSQTILDIAQGRAEQKNWQGAIAAAQLIPDENRPVYEQAQLQIQTWQQQVQIQEANQAKLKAAQAQVKAGQASSFSNAIALVREIPSDQPAYIQAQKLINEWGQEIFKIAQSRAKKGELQEAIEAATLVPVDTASYKPAQEAITQWEEKLKTQKKR